MDFEKYILELNQIKGTSFVELKEESTSIYVSQFKDNNSGIKICFKKSFPVILPDFFVDSSSSVRPHIESNGKICLFDVDSVLIKKDMPEQLLIDCYDKAIEIISLNPKSEEYYNEVVRELGAYWLQNAKQYMTSTIDLHSCYYSEKSMITASAIDGDKISFFAGETLEKTKKLISQFIKYPVEEYVNDCLLIRLKPGAKMIVVKEHYSWAELYQYIIMNTTGWILKKFKEHVAAKRKIVVESIVLIMSSSFGDIAIGFIVHGRARAFVPMYSMMGLSCSPLYIRRMDNRYLKKRGGAMYSLEGKKVLLLGCGSVGGYIAENLCKCGIKTLDILDKDLFSEENLYRHYLGVDSLDINGNNSNKADLMKKRLEAEYFDVDIDSLAFRERNVELLINEPKRFANYDLVISALGEPTLNLEIDRILRINNIKVPFICAFNEPYGIGGHSILTNVSENGCLRCMYTDVLSSELCTFIASLVEPGQFFKKNIAGCSGAYVPYSALDSEQTAINTVRLAISVLQGKETVNCVISWFGDSDTLKNEGYLTSQYYETNFEKYNKRLVIKENSRCPVCS